MKLSLGVTSQRGHTLCTRGREGEGEVIKEGSDFCGDEESQEPEASVQV